MSALPRFVVTCTDGTRWELGAADAASARTRGDSTSAKFGSGAPVQIVQTLEAYRQAETDSFGVWCQANGVRVVTEVQV